MAKKKRKPTMNAIDKYLMQKKYSRGSSFEKSESSTLTQKIVQTKNSSLNRKVKQANNALLPRRETVRSLKQSNDTKIDNQTRLKKTSKAQLHFERTKVSAKRNKNDSRARVTSVKSVPEKIKPKDQKNDMQSAKKSKAAVTRKRRFEKESSKDSKKRRRVEFKIVKKRYKVVQTDRNSEPSGEAAKNTGKHKVETELSRNPTKDKLKIGITMKQSEITEMIKVKQSETVEKDISVQRKAGSELVPKKCVLKNVRRNHIKDIAISNKKPVQSDFETCIESTSLKFHDCRVDSSSDECSNDYEDTSETNSIMKKYQPYMKRIKSLNFEEIAKFIKDNQQYYIDFKSGVESKDKRHPKKPKEELKNLFKCNPFNSEQQIAMYITLREIFGIPQTHFKECRNFFISLLPEISCQLFADVFRIKATFAPRLIKRLYPKPICPV